MAILSPFEIYWVVIIRIIFELICEFDGIIMAPAASHTVTRNHNDKYKISITGGRNSNYYTYTKISREVREVQTIILFIISSRLIIFMSKLNSIVSLFMNFCYGKFINVSVIPSI